MSRPAWLQSDVSVPELFERCGLAVTRRKRAWRFKLPGAQGASVTARYDSGFLTLKLLVPRRRAAEKVDLGRWLELNGRLPGGAKFALDTTSGRLLILAEIPLDPWAHDGDADTVCGRIDEACAGLRTGLELLDLARAEPVPDPPVQSTQQSAADVPATLLGADEANEPVQSPQDRPGPGAEPLGPQERARTRTGRLGEAQGAQPAAIELDFTTELEPGDSAGGPDLGAYADQLRARCLQAGWPTSRSRGGLLSVTLDVPENTCVGRFEAVGADGVRVRSDPCWRAAEEPICRQAIDYLLLRASGVVRLAAAARLPAASGHTVGPYAWQVRWESLPEAAELNDALTALSLACRLTEHEVEALHDTDLARQYLALQGRRSTRS